MMSPLAGRGDGRVYLDEPACCPLLLPRPPSAFQGRLAPFVCWSRGSKAWSARCPSHGSDSLEPREAHWPCRTTAGRAAHFCHAAHAALWRNINREIMRRVRRLWMHTPSQREGDLRLARRRSYGTASVNAGAGGCKGRRRRPSSHLWREERSNAFDAVKQPMRTGFLGLGAPYP